MTTPDKDALRDPVCGMLVQPDNPQRFTYKGQDFVFCSPRCLELFQNQPERYLEHSDEKPEKLRLRPLQRARGPQRPI